MLMTSKNVEEVDLTYWFPVTVDCIKGLLCWSCESLKIDLLWWEGEKVWKERKKNLWKKYLNNYHWLWILGAVDCLERIHSLQCLFARSSCMLDEVWNSSSAWHDRFYSPLLPMRFRKAIITGGDSYRWWLVNKLGIEFHREMLIRSWDG